MTTDIPNYRMSSEFKTMTFVAVLVQHAQSSLEFDAVLEDTSVATLSTFHVSLHHCLN